MSERFRGGGESFSSWSAPREAEASVEMQEHHDAIMRLLAKLIEGSGGLSATAKTQLRQQIQQHLSALGLTGISQLQKISQKLHDAQVRPPVPADYPTKEEFETRMARAISKSTISERAPRVPEDPFASEIAEYGRTNWREVDGRERSLLDHIYGVGIILSNELAYRATFPESDRMLVGDNWQIDNGRHRALALRTLGSDYVARHGMDRWVKAEKAL